MNYPVNVSIFEKNENMYCYLLQKRNGIQHINILEFMKEQAEF